MYPSLTDRRSFLAMLATMGGRLLLGRHGVELKVQAIPTVFFAQPDGRNALVRFVVEGSTAPAGRLRVYDTAHKQLGTAGVIGMSGKLYGELWLPLAKDTQVISELELPGTHGPVRTTHRLTPRRRWTVYCLTASDALVRHEDPEFADHADLLHMADQPPGEGVSFAIDTDGLLQHVVTSPMLLAGSGFNWIGVRNSTTPL